MRVMKNHIDFYLICPSLCTQKHTDYVHLFCFKNGKMKQFGPNWTKAPKVQWEKIERNHSPLTISALHSRRIIVCLCIEFRWRVLRRLARLMKLLDKMNAAWMFCGHRRLAFVARTHTNTLNTFQLLSVVINKNWITFIHGLMFNRSHLIIMEMLIYS